MANLRGDLNLVERLKAILAALKVLAAKYKRSRTTSIGVTAALAAFIFLLRRASRKRWLVTDLSKVGRRVDARSTSRNTDVSEKNVYDIVIVGGGTAGCVLASRLSEDPSIRVLLLEAGGSALRLPFSQIPSAYSKLFHTKWDYNLYTTPQASAGGKSRYWPRGKLLGGCSSINAMMFQCGAPSDYDEWAQIGGDGASSWAYKEFSRYFLKFEKFIPHGSFPLVDTSLRGSMGPVQIGYFGHFSRFASSFIEACTKVDFSYGADLNTARGTLGAGKVLTYINSNGKRVTTESAYLNEDVLERPNLKVAIRAKTTQLLFENTGGQLRATGVEFSKNESGPRFRVFARREVVLSAGAIHTPQILMLSGVGPAEELAKHSISVVSDLPGVGSHLIDHPVIDLNFRSKKLGESLNYLNYPQGPAQILRMVADLIQFSLTARGPLTSNVGEAAAFVRSSDDKLFPVFKYSKHPEDTTSGSDAPDIEIFASPVGYKDHGYGPVPSGDLLGIHVVLLRPTSRGTITLKSSNPFEAPIIDPRYLDAQHDVDVLVRGLQLGLRLAHTEPLASFLDHTEKDTELDHFLHECSVPELEEIARNRIETLYHPTSTARMAPVEEKGVVDAFLRVHGIPNLRVADASIFPNIIAGHTAAPTIAVAEKAADMIKNSLREQIVGST